MLVRLHSVARAGFVPDVLSRPESGRPEHLVLRPWHLTPLRPATPPWIGSASMRPSPIGRSAIRTRICHRRFNG